jgi:bifunctional DNA-binding transcriptional regulator/antitoxin component of YhaV-PrlF toxin-antitoxin module
MRRRTRNRTRISSRNTVTIPIDALRRAGLKRGDELEARAVGPGRIVLSRSDDRIRRHAGALTGVYGPDYLARLRRE